jgi:hypothetical protein
MDGCRGRRQILWVVRTPGTTWSYRRGGWFEGGLIARLKIRHGL